MASRPKSYSKLMVHKLTSNFRAAVSVETAEMCHPQKGEICVKTKYVGINATDVNTTKGRYFTSAKVPFPIGFETVGDIVKVGEGVKHLKVGQSISCFNGLGNSFSEYVCLPADQVYCIPEAKPEYVGLLVSGLTATIGLDKAGRIAAGENVLITAAAGGTGHICVQHAKAAGCHVIGTCSTKEKETALKELGCDRVINYKTEDLAEVLKKEYPNGINVVWETIGGKVFEDLLKNLSRRGRLVVIGGIAGYKSEEKEALPKVDLSTLPEQLLFRSMSVIGFLIMDYMEHHPSYMKDMIDKVGNGKLKILIDDGIKSTGSEFYGMEGIIKGVEHLHSGKSFGKVVVRLS